MSITFGASAQISNSGTFTVTTGGILTQATGSTFFITTSIASTGVTTVTDSYSNSYTQIGATVDDTNGRFLRRFQCTNGVGGAGHTFSGTDSLGGAFTLMAGELLGAATSSALDQSNTNVNGFYDPSVTPFTSNNITITPPANGEILLAVYSSQAFVASLTFTESQGFTVAQSQVVGNTGLPALALAYKIVTGANTYHAAWSDGSTGTSMIASIDSFKGLAGGGAPPQIAPIFHRTNKLFFI